MKSTGVVRKVDELGRIVIPKELRRTMNINERDPMEIFVDGEKIIIKKYESRMTCAVTGEVSDHNLNLFDGKLVLSPEGAEMLVNELKKQALPTA
ncbi:AbrB/MazE/SpoVT family DNA-binding domain-containing protein [Pseudalkalibacillus decolorationis]|uniref:AbrB/MazE/SpoVT family DNA-binding domain-containing protein n=1 Tax=Pseudalkalibacillus decolorationis TaxID=163879 RepID=UPI0021473099|nr:AbrB/MazE/SpoVT family DNA-binding domain-containing protein [Pseudalkalibacillus decolorationis]